MSSSAAPFLTRLRVRDYKSIAHCDIRLGAFNVLFGLNAAGKSNVLDAVRFVRDALSVGPAEAAQERGGWDAVLRRVPTAADACTIALDFRTEASLSDLPAPVTATAEGSYEVSFGRRGIVRERCRITFPGGEAAGAGFAAKGGVVSDPVFGHSLGKVRPGALYLPLAGTTEPYDRLYAALTSMFFHTPDLAALRDARPPTGVDTLAEDGGQLGEVIARMGSWERDRVSTYMRAIVPHLAAIGPENADAAYIAATMTFDSQVGDGEPTRFGAEAMSEGTIRALGQLAALYQAPARDGRIPLVAIEEPELALHPLAAGVLFDALTEASETVQVLATSQSAELFDRKEADLDALLVAVARDGVTSIGPIDSVGRSVVADGLATVGELLRSDQLNPDLGEDA